MRLMRLMRLMKDQTKPTDLEERLGHIPHGMSLDGTEDTARANLIGFWRCKIAVEGRKEGRSRDGSGSQQDDRQGSLDGKGRCNHILYQFL